MTQVLNFRQDRAYVFATGNEDDVSKKKETTDNAPALSQELAVDAASKVDTHVVAPPLTEIVTSTASSVRIIDVSPPRSSLPLSVTVVSGASNPGGHGIPPPSLRGTGPSYTSLRPAVPLLAPNHLQHTPKEFRSKHQKRRSQRQQQNPRQSLGRASKAAVGAEPSFPDGLVFRGGSDLDGGVAVTLQSTGHANGQPIYSAQASGSVSAHQCVSSSMRSTTVTTVGGIGAHDLAVEQQHVHHRHYHHYHHYHPATHGNEAFQSGVVAGLMAATSVSTGAPAALGMYHDDHRQEYALHTPRVQRQPIVPPLHSGQKDISEGAAIEGRVFEEITLGGDARGK